MVDRIGAITVHDRHHVVERASAGVGLGVDWYRAGLSVAVQLLEQLSGLEIQGVIVAVHRPLYEECRGDPTVLSPSQMGVG